MKSCSKSLLGRDTLIDGAPQAASGRLILHGDASPADAPLALQTAVPFLLFRRSAPTSLFHKYEGYIEAHTQSLLAKLNSGSNDIKAEIIDLFAAKLLNFVRNPFSIQKVLNSFPGLASYDPTDPALLAEYRRIVSGKKPHQAYLCAQLGISDAQYVEWLRVLFMLLVPMADGQPNFFEDVIRRLLENRKMHVAAVVNEYDSARCLLSDRGFSQPIADGPHMAFSFNLCATAFVDYVFLDPATSLKGKASPEFIAQAIAKWERLPERRLGSPSCATISTCSHASTAVRSNNATGG